MPRRLSTAASAILLLLGVGIAVLWVRSHFVFDSWSYGRSTGSFCELSSGFGSTCVEVDIQAPARVVAQAVWRAVLLCPLLWARSTAFSQTTKPAGA